MSPWQETLHGCIGPCPGQRAEVQQPLGVRVGSPSTLRTVLSPRNGSQVPSAYCAKAKSQIKTERPSKDNTQIISVDVYVTDRVNPAQRN